MPRIEVACLSHSPQMNMPQAASQALSFRDGGARLADAIKAYNPNLVVYFGPDHRRALTEIVPSFTVVEQAEGFGDWDTPTTRYSIPVTIVQALTQFLLAREFDVAVAKNLRLDHGFGLTLCQLFGGLDAVPVLPVAINCIGAPLPSMHRVSALGVAIGEFLTMLSSHERVLILASGGISHYPPTLEPGFHSLTSEQRSPLFARAREFVVPEWDEAFLRRLASPDWRELSHMSDETIAPAGLGAHELRCWVAAAFAGDRPLKRVAYEPVLEWITGMGICATETLLAA